MDRLDRHIHTLGTAFARFAGGLMVFIAVIVAIDVVTRNVTGQTYLNAYEYSRYLFAVALSFGMSYVLLCGAHIRLDIVYQKFPDPIRSALDLLSSLSLAILACGLAWFAVDLTLESYHNGTISTSAASTPLALPQGVWALGLVVFAVTAVFMAARHVLALVGGPRAETAYFSSDREIEEAVADAAAQRGT
ncbi:TRAP transporter small permease subunit [Allosediminivita pacifica]|nr:TRAP transporter small permease subunit [Allosediminivita pacifica]